MYAKVVSLSPSFVLLFFFRKKKKLGSSCQELSLSPPLSDIFFVVVAKHLQQARV